MGQFFLTPAFRLAGGDDGVTVGRYPLSLITHEFSAAYAPDRCRKWTWATLTSRQTMGVMIEPIDTNQPLSVLECSPERQPKTGRTRGLCCLCHRRRAVIFSHKRTRVLAGQALCRQCFESLIDSLRAGQPREQVPSRRLPHPPCIRHGRHERGDG